MTSEIMSPGSTVTAPRSFASAAEGIFRRPHPSVAPYASVVRPVLATCTIRHWIPLPPCWACSTRAVTATVPLTGLRQPAATSA